MSTVFIIEDSFHAEEIGTYNSFEQALEYLKKIKNIPWGSDPNLPPCESGASCERNYEIIEYAVLGNSYKELKRTPVLNISRSFVSWLL